MPILGLRPAYARLIHHLKSEPPRERVYNKSNHYKSSLGIEDFIPPTRATDLLASVSEEARGAITVRNVPLFPICRLISNLYGVSTILG